MTGDRLHDYEGSSWYDFWRNLTEGYEYFERHRRPPNVEVEDGRYVFDPD